ncbi:MAG: hypothetical protein IKT52_10370 [Oscillospiraceae bacterium]|nr:hypothetical protein [Oscillospiraceae bacterium]
MADVGISRYDACLRTAYRCIEAGDCHVALRAPRNDMFFERHNVANSPKINVNTKHSAARAAGRRPYIDNWNSTTN